MPTPLSARCSGIVGLFQLLSVICPNFAAVAELLARLLRKSVKFELGPEQQDAMRSLKDTITSGPVLAIIQDAGDLVLDVDSSLYITGCVLQ